MSTIVTRAGKGSPLTHAEMDANLNNLNTDKAELTSLIAADGVLLVGNAADKRDLASTASGKGAALVGRSATVVSSITALRALLKTSAGQHAFVTGYYAQGDGGGGAYWYDSTDTTSADNGGTIIVATDGGRWKLSYQGRVSVKQFGAKGDGITDDTVTVQNAATALANLYYPASVYVLTAPIVISNKAIDWQGDGIESTILKWTGAGMAAANGITYTNTIAQVPVRLADMALVAVPSITSPTTLAGDAISITFPDQSTNLEFTVMLERVRIRPDYTGDTWAPTARGGWTRCCYLQDAGKPYFRHCNFWGPVTANVPYAVYILTNSNPDWVVFDSCEFGSFYKAIFVTAGTDSFGGLVVNACNFESVNIGIDVAVTSDLIQVYGTYFQCYTQGIRSLARTTLIQGARIDMVLDPQARYAPAVAQAIVIGNGVVSLDGGIISGNNFGGDAITKHAVTLTAAVNKTRVTNNVFGAIAAYGTAYAVGCVLESGSDNNIVSNNSKGLCTTMVTDAGTNNAVYDNLPSEGMMNLTGATPSLKSGAGGATLGKHVYLTQAGPTNVTNLTNGFVGQEITLVAGDNNSTIVAGANISLNGGVNFAMVGNNTLSLFFDATTWREVGRKV